MQGLDAPTAACYFQPVSLRPRYAYLDDDGTVHTVSQARYARVMDPHQREPIPELAGRRVRFLTLYVEFADGIPLEVLNVEARMITFDAEGRRDQDDARRALQAAVGLLDTAFGSSKPTTVVPAAARFQSAGLRWKPTSAEVDAVIAAHRLWRGW